MREGRDGRGSEEVFGDVNVTICSTQPAVTNLPRVRQSVTIRGTKACGHRLVALRAPIVPSALLSVTACFRPCFAGSPFPSNHSPVQARFVVVGHGFLQIVTLSAVHWYLPALSKPGPTAFFGMQKRAGGSLPFSFVWIVPGCISKRGAYV